ncbi:MAG: hypothetical protein SV186_03345 [Candidatus Nanohaloarchaea archaeon]|nr:hypothetical protein [Candidatus Nanohaloarchaea archaeon]
MHRRSALAGLLLLAALAAGCTSQGNVQAPDLQTLVERDGQYRLTYDVSRGGGNYELGLRVFSAGDWHRKELTISLYDRSVTLSRYSHGPSGISFFCETGNSPVNASDCRFGSRYEIYFPMLATDPAALARAGNATFTGMRTVQGRECAGYRFRFTTGDLYDANATGVNQLNDTLVADTCIDTAQGYVAAMNLSSPNEPSTETVRIRVSSYTSEVDRAAPPVTFVAQLHCAGSGGYTAELLAVQKGGTATITVDGREQQVRLERMQRRTVDIEPLLDGVENTVDITFNGATVTRLCPYIDG